MAASWTRRGSRAWHLAGAESPAQPGGAWPGSAESNRKGWSLRESGLFNPEVGEQETWASLRFPGPAWPRPGRSRPCGTCILSGEPVRRVARCAGGPGSGNPGAPGAARGRSRSGRGRGLGWGGAWVGGAGVSPEEPQERGHPAGPAFGFPSAWFVSSIASPVERSALGPVNSFHASKTCHTRILSSVYRKT